MHKIEPDDRPKIYDFASFILKRTDDVDDDDDNEI
jgi:hypothetical protein